VKNIEETIEMAKQILKDNSGLAVQPEEIDIIQDLLSHIEQTPKWVSCEDGLPEHDKTVLMYWRPIDHEKRPFHKEIIVGNFQYDVANDFSRYVWANGRIYDIDIFITHWMLLPEAPE